MDLVLTKGQEDAIALINRAVQVGWREIPYAVVAGYAGTGKTTLLKVCGELKPLQLAPTGKAALRLRAATGADAQTIHRAIYNVRDQACHCSKAGYPPGQHRPGCKAGDPKFTPKAVVAPGARVILCDEASMVTREALRGPHRSRGGARAPDRLHRRSLPAPAGLEGRQGRLQRHGAANAPPGGATEVLRQALDSPIIAASMKIRLGNVDAGLALLEVTGRNHAVAEMVRIHRAGGATIAHRNATRFKINGTLRRALGIPHEERDAQPGEPILITRNNYGLGIFNGEVLAFMGWRVAPQVFYPFGPEGRGYPCGVAEINGRPGWLCRDNLHGDMTSGQEFELSKFMEGEIIKEISLRPLPLIRANFGYCLTAHKAQGSEWDKVLVVMEDQPEPGPRGGPAVVLHRPDARQEEVHDFMGEGARQRGAA